MRFKSRGAVLALLVIALPLFILLLALAIDLTLAAAAQQQARSLARLLALKAIESFNRPGENFNSLESRLNQVKSDAETLLSDSEILGYALDPQSVSVLGLNGAQSSEVALLPGSYFVGMLPADQCTSGNCNPCSNNETPPCFVPVQDPTSATSRVNAFRVNIEGDRSISSFFTRAALNAEGLRPKASATAMVVPRHIMFVVDISRSMIGQTHLYRRPVQSQIDNPQVGRGAQVAFEATEEAIRCLSGSGQACDSNSSVDPAQVSDYAQWRFLNRYNNNWTESGLSRNSASGAPSGGWGAVHHFFDDYIRISVKDQRGANDGSPTLDGACPSIDVRDSNTDGDKFHPSIGANGEYSSNFSDYFIDDYSFLNQTGPQPLSSVLGGLNQLVSNLQARQFSSDLVGAVFFERMAYWNRIIRPNDQYEYLRDITGERCYQYRLGIFPTTERFTDLRLAILEAVNQLNMVRGDRSFPSQDSVVLITDGMTNCTQYNAQSGVDMTRIDLNGDGRIDISDLTRFLNCFGRDPALDPNVPAYCPSPALRTQDLIRFMNMLGQVLGCANDLAHYQASMRDVKLQVQQIASGEVRFHVLAAGNHIGPNIRLFKRNPGTNDTACMTESEARERRLSTVEGGWPDGNGDPFNEASPQRPFRQALADLYDIARLSGGVFQALFPEPATTCQTVTSCAQESQTLTSDPLCRSQTQQINDFINSAVNDQSPFVVVASD